MVSSKDIQVTCEDIVREFSPLQVILFGSYAYGTPLEESDVDLLVVMPIPKSEFCNKAVEIRQRIPYRFGMDLLVRSPEEIAYRVSYNDWFLREITEKGKLLYGSYTDYNLDKPYSVKEEEVYMNPLTVEWIEKAEEDYNAAKWLQESPTPIHNAICFHAQQCIEKYLKAWLQEENIPFSKTHDLEELLKIMSSYAVEAPYLGDSASAKDTEHAIQICDEVRQKIRAELKERNREDDQGGYLMISGQFLKHITKLKETTKPHWYQLPSQMIRDVAIRIDLGYQRFFDNIEDRKVGKTTRKVGRPKIKPNHKYKSVTFT